MSKNTGRQITQKQVLAATACDIIDTSQVVRSYDISLKNSDHRPWHHNVKAILSRGVWQNLVLMESDKKQTLAPLQNNGPSL